MFSSHRAYLGIDTLPWLTTDYALAQFAKHKSKAKKLYHDFVLKGSTEDYRQEFYKGLHEGRILGDDRFSERALTKAAEKYRRKLLLEEVIEAVCDFYDINANLLADPGKARPASEARAVAALLVQESDNLKLTKLGFYLKRDLATLSQSANRLRKPATKDKTLWEKIENIRNELQ